MHGFTRATKDLDIVPDPTPDIMQWVAGVGADLAYDELQPRALAVQFRGAEIRVCSLEHLRAMKLAAGRPQDLEDLRRLE